MSCGPQIGAGGILQSVRVLVTQGCSLRKRCRAEARRYTKTFFCETAILLHFVAGAEVVRVERLAAGKAFVLAMIKTDAVFAEFPAEVNVLIVDNRGKIEKTHVQVLDDAACFEDAVE